MGILANTLQVLLLFSGIFLMIVILLQRGRGGGLAGAFGGAGGQSAFGTKAGDVFTWITVVTATVWVLLAGVGGCAMRSAETNVSNEFAAGDDESSTDGDETEDSVSPGITPGDLTPPGDSSTPSDDESATESETDSSTQDDATDDSTESTDESSDSTDETSESETENP